MKHISSSCTSFFFLFSRKCCHIWGCYRKGYQSEVDLARITYYWWLTRGHLPATEFPRDGSWTQSGTRQRSLIGRQTGTCEKYGASEEGTSGRMGRRGPRPGPISGWTRKKVHAHASCLWSGKVAGTRALRVSGGCADMRLTQTRNGFSPNLSHYIPVRYN